MSEKQRIRRVYTRFGEKSLMVLTALVVLFSVAYVAPISLGAPPVKNIRIGVVAPWGDIPDYYGYEEYVRDLYKQIVEPDINAYLAKLPQSRFTPRIQVEFIIESAGPECDPAVHLEMVKKFHRMGINLIIGGHYTFLAAESLEYVNTHDMVMISPTSTGADLAIPDNLFRLAPDDTWQGKAIAKMLDDKGVTSLVIIHQDDSWANGILSVIEPLFSGDMDYVPYAVGTSDFSDVIDTAETKLIDNEGDGVLLLSTDGDKILVAAEGSDLLSVDWFGSDGTAQNSLIVGNPDALEIAAQVKLYSTVAAMTPEAQSSSKYLEMKPRFKAFFPDDALNLYTASEIDAGWLLTISVLETQKNILPSISGNEIVQVLPDIASRYYGYSGWCELNSAGDRAPLNYEIWGYDDTGYHYFGMYNTASDTITWI